MRVENVFQQLWRAKGNITKERRTERRNRKRRKKTDETQNHIRFERYSNGPGQKQGVKFG